MLSARIDGLDVAIDNLKQIRSPALRKRIFNKCAMHLIKTAKARIADQADLDGKPFPPHAKARRRKMLARLVRRLAAMNLTDAGAEVGWRNSFEGMIAARQQYGYVATFNKRQFKDRKTLNTKEPATRQQAKGLIEAGYKVRRKDGKGGLKTPTIKWITENLNMGKAGLILRILRGSKEEWKTTLPPRSFLGVTLDDLLALDEVIGKELQAAFSQARAA